MPFHEKLALNLSQNNLGGANCVVMQELGKVAIHHRADFVDLLVNSDAPADAELADAELLNLYMDNIHKKELLIGTAFLVNLHNKKPGFDGEQEINDVGVKSSYQVMSNFFGQMDVVGNGRDKYKRSEEWKSGFIVDTILKGATGITGKVLDGQNKKKYGALDALKAKQKAKSDIAQSMMAERQKQIDNIQKEKEEKGKILKIGLIVGGSLIALGIGAFIYLKIRK